MMNEQILMVGATQIRNLSANDRAQRLTPTMIAQSLEKAPRRLRNLVKGILIHDAECPFNHHWQQTTGQADFQAFATADSDQFTIEFWANSHVVDPTRNLDYVVLHELGHLLDRKLGMRAADKALRQRGRKVNRKISAGMTYAEACRIKPPKGFRRYYWSEEGTSWSRAMMLDMALNPQAHVKGFISRYAALHSLDREDFADSVALLIADPIHFALRYPNRYQFLAKKLGMTQRKAN